MQQKVKAFGALCFAARPSHQQLYPWIQLEAHPPIPSIFAPMAIPPKPRVSG